MALGLDISEWFMSPKPLPFAFATEESVGQVQWLRRREHSHFLPGRAVPANLGRPSPCELRLCQTRGFHYEPEPAQTFLVL